MSYFMNSIKNLANSYVQQQQQQQQQQHQKGPSRSNSDDNNIRKQQVEVKDMKFSLSPPQMQSPSTQKAGTVDPITSPSSSDFDQWLHAMKMVARLPGGMPPEFRRKLWLALAEKYLQTRNVNWEQEEAKCFSEKCREDDEELGIQIVKDLHRTGSSLCSGPAGTINQAKLKRILLGYARWNPEVGYCQGFNMLGAMILQVMDKNESESMKVMIFLVEGVLPPGYFSGSLGGLQADMAVFRELMTSKLPKLARHLQRLQGKTPEDALEPPLTNVFTMQWFLTLFCTCLPINCVLRVWDLSLIEGSDVLLRTALAIWSILEEKILSAKTADDFYCKMGTLSGELLNGHLLDSNSLVERVVELGPIPELQKLRDKHLYNVSPWKDKKGLKLYYSDDEGDSDDDSRLAVTTAWGLRINRRGSFGLTASSKPTPDNRDRIALDISLLKKQYDRLRERQRQAHIILTAARQAVNPVATQPSLQMNQLLLGRNAIVTNKGRRIGPPPGAIPPARKAPCGPTKSAPSAIALGKATTSKQNKRGETLHWQDMEAAKRRKGSIKWKDVTIPTYGNELPEIEDTKSRNTLQKTTGRVRKKSESSSYSEDSDANSSTSTSLCDEEDPDNADTGCSSLEASPRKLIKSKTPEIEVPIKDNLEESLSACETDSESIISSSANSKGLQDTNFSKIKMSNDLSLESMDTNTKYQVPMIKFTETEDSLTGVDKTESDPNSHSSNLPISCNIDSNIPEEDSSTECDRFQKFVDNETYEDKSADETETNKELPQLDVDNMKQNIPEIKQDTFSASLTKNESESSKSSTPLPQPSPSEPETQKSSSLPIEEEEEEGGINYLDVTHQSSLAITSTSQLSPIADISKYLSSSNISPLKTPTLYFDYTDLVSKNVSTHSDENDITYKVNEEGVTNQYFERVNLERPKHLDLLYSLNESQKHSDYFSSILNNSSNVQRGITTASKSSPISIDTISKTVEEEATVGTLSSKNMEKTEPSSERKYEEVQDNSTASTKYTSTLKMSSEYYSNENYKEYSEKDKITDKVESSNPTATETRKTDRLALNDEDELKSEKNLTRSLIQERSNSDVSERLITHVQHNTKPISCPEARTIDDHSQSDRILKIIEENSQILHRILKKNFPVDSNLISEEIDERKTFLKEKKTNNESTFPTLNIEERKKYICLEETKKQDVKKNEDLQSVQNIILKDLEETEKQDIKRNKDLQFVQNTVLKNLEETEKEDKTKDEDNQSMQNTILKNLEETEKDDIKKHEDLHSEQNTVIKNLEETEKGDIKKDEDRSVQNTVLKSLDDDLSSFLKSKTKEELDDRREIISLSQQSPKKIEMSMDEKLISTFRTQSGILDLSSIQLRSDDNLADRLESIKNTIKSIDTLCDEKEYRKEKCQRYIDSLFNENYKDPSSLSPIKINIATPSLVSGETYTKVSSSDLVSPARITTSATTTVATSSPPDIKIEEIKVRTTTPDLRDLRRSPKNTSVIDEILSSSLDSNTDGYLSSRSRSFRDIKREVSPRRRRDDDHEEYVSRTRRDKMPKYIDNISHFDIDETSSTAKSNDSIANKTTRHFLVDKLDKDFEMESSKSSSNSLYKTKEFSPVKIDTNSNTTLREGGDHDIHSVSSKSPRNFSTTFLNDDDKTFSSSPSSCKGSLINKVSPTNRSVKISDFDIKTTVPTVYVPAKINIRHTTVTSTFYDRYLSKKLEKNSISVTSSKSTEKLSPLSSSQFNITKSYLDSLRPSSNSLSSSFSHFSSNKTNKNSTASYLLSTDDYLDHFNRNSKSAENSPSREKFHNSSNSAKPLESESKSDRYSSYSNDNHLSESNYYYLSTSNKSEQLHVRSCDNILLRLKSNTGMATTSTANATTITSTETDKTNYERLPFMTKTANTLTTTTAISPETTKTKLTETNDTTSSLSSSLPIYDSSFKQFHFKDTEYTSITVTTTAMTTTGQYYYSSLTTTTDSTAEYSSSNNIGLSPSSRIYSNPISSCRSPISTTSGIDIQLDLYKTSKRSYSPPAES